MNDNALLVAVVEISEIEKLCDKLRDQADFMEQLGFRDKAIAYNFSVRKICEMMITKRKVVDMRDEFDRR